MEALHSRERDDHPNQSPTSLGYADTGEVAKKSISEVVYISTKTST